MVLLLLCRSFNHSAGLMSGDDGTMSPMLKAERQLEKSYNNSSPSKHRARHHQYYSDKTRHISNKSAGSSEKSPAEATTDELSPQPLSDATQSSDNSSRGHHSKHNHHRSNRKSSHRHSTHFKHSSAEQLTNTPTTTQHNYTKDDLVSAYSPIVDRQRHSSSASSSGPAAVRSGASPTRQSMERPYGYHHVGASVSPSKRTQQWAVLHVSPFSRTPERHRCESKDATTPSSAKKNLNFALNRTPEKSPQKPKM